MARFRVLIDGDNLWRAYRVLSRTTGISIRSPVYSVVMSSRNPGAKSNPLRAEVDADSAEAAEARVRERLPKGCRIVRVEPVE
jgi:hypothetical protein